MKRCPRCGQNYSSDDLNFCLSDGEQLAYVPDFSSDPTIIKSPPFVQAVSPPAKKPFYASAVFLIIGLLAVGLLIAVIGGAAMMWVKFDSSNSSNNHNENAAAVPTPVEQKTPAANESADNLQQTRDALEKERQKLADERKKLEIKKIQTAAAPKVPTVPPLRGNWFVVLGSYPKTENEKANQRLRIVRGLGYDAAIIDTGNYPGFKDDLYSVVAGPFSKADAESLMNKMKSSIPDAYIKSGR